MSNTKQQYKNKYIFLFNLFHYLSISSTVKTAATDINRTAEVIAFHNLTILQMLRGAANNELKLVGSECYANKISFKAHSSFSLQAKLAFSSEAFL